MKPLAIKFEICLSTKAFLEIIFALFACDQENKLVLDLKYVFLSIQGLG
jgi:hypothetical protein